MILSAKDTNGKSIRLYKIASAVILALILAISAVAFLIGFDEGSRYLVFSPSAAAIYTVFGIGIGFWLSGFIVFDGNSVVETDGMAHRILSFISAVGTAVFFLYYIYGNFSDKQSPISGLDSLSAAMIITCVATFAYSVAKTVRAGKAPTLILGYCRTIFFALIITKLYLDFSVELNAPVKLIIQFAASALMLSTVADLRIIAGRVSAGAFVLSKLLAMALCSLNTVLLITEILPHADKYGNNYIAFSLLIAFCGIENAFEFFASVTKPVCRQADGDTLEDTLEETVGETVEEKVDGSVDECGKEFSGDTVVQAVDTPSNSEE